MWTWLQDNHGAVSALANIATLAVWTLYFQLLLGNYRHRIRPKILINQGAGHSLHAHCLIANMSAEPVYFEAIITDIGYRSGDETTYRRSRCSLSDLDVEVSDQGDRRPQWMQGPLDSSEFIDIGSYGQLIDRTTEQGDIVDTVHELTVTIVATYTARDTPVAARRTFDLRRTERGTQLEPQTYTAEQIRSRAELRSIRAYLQRKP
ncbi:MAG: hypothetical protein CMJ42_12255 [Phyllobacteriaceae bacterium]|nr:hypothetical protein [Phyllobacteriaceae bacterium]MBA91703.1 hypothetical protein [Phyllobacteriaceae bacterium]